MSRSWPRPRLALPAALAATAAAQTQPVFVNGQAQVVPAFNVSAQWVRHRLWVETEFDSDGDGKRDRMHVDVTRPAQTDSEDLKVPVVYETSPYYAGTATTASQYLWNVNHELGAAPPPRALAAGDHLQPEPDLDLDQRSQHVGAARLRRRPLGVAGHGPLAGLPDGRRHERE